MLNLGDYFVTTKGGFCPLRIEEYSKSFDKVFVFCLGNKSIKKFNNNTTIYSGNILKWIYYFIKIPKKNIEFIKIQDLYVGGGLGALFSIFLKVPLVMRCGGEWKYKNNSVINIIKNFIGWISRKIIFLKISKIVFNSKYVQRKVLYKKDINSSVVYNGVDLKKFYPKKKLLTKKPGKLIYVGRVRYDKGLTYLRDAMKKLNNYNLTVIGKGPLIEELNNEKNIKCLGRIEHDNIPDKLREHDMFVLPTLPESSESFPSALIEAIACGLPVVATDVAGISEIIQKDKLIKAYSSEKIIERIKKPAKINKIKLDAKTQLKRLRKELFGK